MASELQANDALNLSSLIFYTKLQTKRRIVWRRDKSDHGRWGLLQRSSEWKLLLVFSLEREIVKKTSKNLNWPPPILFFNFFWIEKFPNEWLKVVGAFLTFSKLVGHL